MSSIARSATMLPQTYHDEDNNNTSSKKKHPLAAAATASFTTQRKPPRRRRSLSSSTTTTDMSTSPLRKKHAAMLRTAANASSKHEDGSFLIQVGPGGYTSGAIGAVGHAYNMKSIFGAPPGPLSAKARASELTRLGGAFASETVTSGNSTSTGGRAHAAQHSPVAIPIRRNKTTLADRRMTVVSHGVQKKKITRPDAALQQLQRQPQRSGRGQTMAQSGKTSVHMLGRASSSSAAKKTKKKHSFSKSSYHLLADSSSGGANTKGSDNGKKKRSVGRAFAPQSPRVRLPDDRNEGRSIGLMPSERVADHATDDKSHLDASIVGYSSVDGRVRAAGNNGKGKRERNESVQQKEMSTEATILRSHKHQHARALRNLVAVASTLRGGIFDDDAYVSDAMREKRGNDASVEDASVVDDGWTKRYQGDAKDDRFDMTVYTTPSYVMLDGEACLRFAEFGLQRPAAAERTAPLSSPTAAKKSDKKMSHAIGSTDKKGIGGDRRKARNDRKRAARFKKKVKKTYGMPTTAGSNQMQSGQTFSFAQLAQVASEASVVQDDNHTDRKNTSDGKQWSGSDEEGGSGNEVGKRDQPDAQHSAEPDQSTSYVAPWASRRRLAARESASPGTADRDKEREMIRKSVSAAGLPKSVLDQLLVKHSTMSVADRRVSRSSAFADLKKGEVRKKQLHKLDEYNHAHVSSFGIGTSAYDEVLAAAKKADESKPVELLSATAATVARTIASRKQSLGPVADAEMRSEYFMSRRRRRKSVYRQAMHAAAEAAILEERKRDLAPPPIAYTCDPQALQAMQWSFKFTARVNVPGVSMEQRLRELSPQSPRFFHIEVFVSGSSKWEHVFTTDSVRAIVDEHIVNAPLSFSVSWPTAAIRAVSLFSENDYSADGIYSQILFRCWSTSAASSGVYGRYAAAKAPSSGSGREDEVCDYIGECVTTFAALWQYLAKRPTSAERKRALESQRLAGNVDANQLSMAPLLFSLVDMAVQRSEVVLAASMAGLAASQGTADPKDNSKNSNTRDAASGPVASEIVPEASHGVLTLVVSPVAPNEASSGAMAVRNSETGNIGLGSGASKANSGPNNIKSERFQSMFGASSMESGAARSTTSSALSPLASWQKSLECKISRPRIRVTSARQLTQMEVDVLRAQRDAQRKSRNRKMSAFARFGALKRIKQMAFFRPT